MDKRVNNLIICLTPLQMVIAQKIINLNPGSNYDIICFSYNKNDKYTFYYNKISLKCVNSFRFNIYSTKKIMRIFDLMRLKYFLVNKISKNYQRIYLASIDNPFIHLVLSWMDKSEIYTYDDGSANINLNSIYFKPPVHSSFQQRMMGFLGNKYDLSRVKNESVLHYTIYKNFKNIIDKTFFLPLFENNFSGNGTKKIKIFLGQPLHEFDGKFEKKIINFLKVSKVKNYYPHPRENIVFDGFDYIESPLIFEDFILKLISDNYFIELYALTSTAILNILGFSSVKVYCLYDDSSFKKNRLIYDIFKNNNVELINIEK
ncbi:MAG: glycosyltransferase family 52 [Alphaproteobacteria bacterium]